jgi:glycosyltransferase involved in cell wall biosynthesis
MTVVDTREAVYRRGGRYRFTVFTPTYNRAYILPRVYECLKRQTWRDFEWLIVDDGSTDNTRELVEAWQQENPFSIRYFWQENAHKKAAFNLGVKEAQGELFLTWDSDDEAVPDALEILHRHWGNIPEAQRDEFSAVTGLCIDRGGAIVGSRFPADVFDSDSLAIRYRYRIESEKWGFQRTDVLRRFPFPQDVRGHVPEGVVWSAIASRYKTRFVNDVLRIYQTEADSITQATNAGQHADGHALWAREVLCNEWSWFRYNPKWFLKIAANYTRFHLHLTKSQSGKRWPLRGSVPRLLVALMRPVGVLRYWLDIRRATSA